MAENYIQHIRCLHDCRSGNLEGVKNAVESGLNVDSDYRFTTPLGAACDNGHLHIVKYLVEQCKVDVNPPLSYLGETPLMFACLNKHIEVVHYLVDHGANVSVPIAEKTILYCAISRNGTGIESSERWSKWIDVGGNKREQVPIYLLDYLIAHGADINERNFNGRTILHEACAGHLNCFLIRYISRGANVNLTDNKGISPLMSAAFEANLGVVNILLELGNANIHLEDDDGDTVLDWLYRMHHFWVEHKPDKPVIRKRIMRLAPQRCNHVEVNHYIQVSKKYAFLVDHVHTSDVLRFIRNF